MTSKKWSEPKGKPSNKDDASENEIRELELFTENDSDINRQRLASIYKNLSRKKYRGVYDHDKAVKGMRYAVDDANKKYAKEYATSDFTFSTTTRNAVAEKLVNNFESDFDAGNYSHYKQKYLNKKRNAGD